MPNLTIKGLSREVHERLRRRAKARGRSLNREILQILEGAVGARTLDPEEVIARIDELHRRFGTRPTSDAEIRAARREGRP